jgi:hypothetical protein
MISSSWMTPIFTPIYSPELVALMVSIIAFGKLCSGAKNYRLGTLKWDFENVGIVLYSTEIFSGKYVLEIAERRRRIYEKGHCV